MNREGAALGIPVYSIFRGSIGAVDRQLQREGRLVFIESVDDIAAKLSLRRRDKDAGRSRPGSTAVLNQIVDRIDAVARATVRHG